MIILTFPYSQPGPHYGEIRAALWSVETSAIAFNQADEYASKRPGYCVHAIPYDHMPLQQAKDKAIADRKAYLERREIRQ